MKKTFSTLLNLTMVALFLLTACVRASYSAACADLNSDAVAYTAYIHS